MKTRDRLLFIALGSVLVLSANQFPLVLPSGSGKNDFLTEADALLYHLQTSGLLFSFSLHSRTESKHLRAGSPGLACAAQDSLTSSPFSVSRI